MKRMRSGSTVHSGVAIELRQCEYLKNLVQQDLRGIKRSVRSMLGFKDFDCARTTIAGIETMHTAMKGQLDVAKASPLRC